MRNGRRVLLTVLNLYIQIKICVVTFDTNLSITDSMQTVICWFNPEASRFCKESVNRARHRQGRYVTHNDLVIDQFEFSC
jgi:hypothetical protein